MRAFALLSAAALLSDAAPTARQRPRLPPLSAAIDKLLAAPAATRALWGIEVVDLSSGRVLYERSAATAFTPASNAKLFSTALALLRLGPDYTFQTRVLAAARVEEGGLIRGDLVLAGGGDPTLSARPIPYRPGAFDGTPFQAIDDLADQLLHQGVHRIDGDIVGDDTHFPWDPHPGGWTVDDATYDYGAPVSALTLNDNTLRLLLKPGASAGDPVEIELQPPVELFTIQNYLRTVDAATSSTTYSFERSPGAVRLFGELKAGKPEEESIAVDDPALFAAQIFADALRRRGIAIGGRPVARHRLSGEPFEPLAGIELTHRHSPPLIEILRTINKASQNLHAEIILRETARVRRGDATLRNGIGELKSLLSETGASPEATDLSDGSGLSRRSLVSADSIVKLLVTMNRSSHAAAWWSLMPIGGADGTLERRFRGLPLAATVRAKTGSISHVNALSGYAGLDPANRIAFSILSNNTTAPAFEIRAIIDKIAVEIAKRADR